MSRRTKALEPAAERCPMCGSTGHVHERDLADDLFGVPGRFTLDRCDAPSCGLVWLDGMPDEDGCGAFYQSYYTHAEAPLDAPRSGPLKRIVDALWPIGAQRARRAEMYSFFLPDAGGTVMEAGCGAGKNLAKLRARGWDVVDIDVGRDLPAKLVQNGVTHAWLALHGWARTRPPSRTSGG